MVDAFKTKRKYFFSRRTPAKVYGNLKVMRTLKGYSFDQNTIDDTFSKNTFVAFMCREFSSFEIIILREIIILTPGIKQSL